KAPRAARIGLHRDASASAGGIQRRALRVGTKLLFRELPRPLFQSRAEQDRQSGIASRVRRDRGETGAVAARFSSPRLSVAKYFDPNRPGLFDRFPGNASWSPALRSRVAAF